MVFHGTDGSIIPVFFRVDLPWIWGIGDGGGGRQNNDAFDGGAGLIVSLKATKEGAIGRASCEHF